LKLKGLPHEAHSNRIGDEKYWRATEASKVRASDERPFDRQGYGYSSK
jgi:hypothetical protein